MHGNMNINEWRCLPTFHVSSWRARWHYSIFHKNSVYWFSVPLILFHIISFLNVSVPAFLLSSLFSHSLLHFRVPCKVVVKVLLVLYFFFWVIPRHYPLCNWTHPYRVTLLPIDSGYFRAKPFPVWIPQKFSNLVILHLPAYEVGTDRVFRNVFLKESI